MTTTYSSYFGRSSSVDGGDSKESNGRRTTRQHLQHDEAPLLNILGSLIDFDDESGSVVTDDAATNDYYEDDYSESSKCETSYDEAPPSRPRIDWDRINILGTELLNVLQTSSRPVLDSDGRISADDESCRDGARYVLDNICSWYRSYQQEYGTPESDPQDNDKLSGQQCGRPEERSLDPDRTVLIRAGCHCEETEPPMESEVILLHLVEAEEVLLSTTHESWDLEDLRQEWREWFGVQRIIQNYLTFLGDHGYNPRSNKPCLPHLPAIQKKVHELLLVPRPRDLPANGGWRHLKMRSPSPDIQTRPGYQSAEDLYYRALRAERRRKAFYKTSDTGRSRAPFWVPPVEWPAWVWDPVRGKHIKARFDPDSPIEDAPYWCPETDWFNWRRDPELGWVPMSLEELAKKQEEERLLKQAKKEAEEQQQKLALQSHGVKHERDDEDDEGESSQMASKRARRTTDT
ncbi:hypothetical protein BGX34_001384, partial [Mortierella sp. NVP85]